jgi:pilus assembly protein FimV
VILKKCSSRTGCLGKKKGNKARKFVAILTILLSSMATQVYALGLGAVTVESALNQPLRVRIEVVQLGDTRLEDVLVQVASADDFQRFNIDRIGFLSNLRFRVENTPQGNAVIVTSNQIVREPYLSFVLETRWPNGRLLSEHTILLDLPVFDDQQSSSAVAQPISPILQAPGQGRADTQPFVDQSSNAPVAAPSAGSSVIAPAAVEEAGVSNDEDTSAADIQPEIASDDPAARNGAVEPETTEPEIIEPEMVEITEAIDDEQVSEEIEEIGDAAEESATPETIETSSTDMLTDIALQVRPDDSVSMQQIMLAIQELNPDAFIDGNINRMRVGQVLRVPSLANVESIDPREAVNEVARQNEQFAQVDVQPLAAPSTATPDQGVAAQGQLSVVSAEDAEDSNGGASDSDSAANDELDRRILQLEAELALRQEEADRARVERVELESRLAEMEEQITAAQEIIRLQDLQLAQLQQELAEAAEQANTESEQQAAASAAVQVQQPAPASGGIIDDALRVLGANTLFAIIGVILIILLIVFLLLRRNRAVRLDDEELAEIAEGGAPDIGDDDSGEFVNSELDSELDDILADIEDDESDNDKSDDAVADASSSESIDVLAQGSEFISAGQYARAISLLNTSLEEQGEDEEVRLILAEAYAREGDRDGFDTESQTLGNSAGQGVAEKLAELRMVLDNSSSVSGSTVIDFDDADADAEEEDSKAETQFFLDDLGIELYAFDEHEAFSESIDDSASEQNADESNIEPGSIESVDTIDTKFSASEGSDADTDSLDDEEMGMTFDLSGDSDGSEAEEAADDSSAVEELDTFEFSIDDSEDEPADNVSANDPEDLEIETFSFDAETLDPEQAQVAEADSDDGSEESKEDDEEEIDLSDFELSDEGKESDADLSTDDEDFLDLDAIGDDSEDQDIEFDIDTADEGPADTAVETASADDADDLEFLNDSDDLEVESVADVEFDDDESATKLELAYAYQKMGDSEGAKEILQEVMSEGTAEQSEEASKLLESLE